MQCISFIYPFIPFLSVAIIILLINNNLRENYAYKNIDKSVKNIFHIVVILWVAYGIFYTYMAYNSNEEIYNRVGDAFGAFNALFSGVAFVGTIYAIILQIKELRSTKEELAAQKQELQIQNATSVQARFENTFFNLLETHRVIAKKVSFSKTNKLNNKIEQIKGIYSFMHLVSNIKNHIQKSHKFKKLETNIVSCVNNNKEFGRYIYDYPEITCEAIRIGDPDGIFDSYFRLTYRILKFVDMSDLRNVAKVQNINNIHDDNIQNDISMRESKLKYNYIGIFRAQLSSYELSAIFYNGIVYEKMKFYIEKYHLLKNLRFETLHNHFMIFFYKPSAFFTLNSAESASIDDIIDILERIYTKNDCMRISVNKWYNSLNK